MARTDGIPLPGTDPKMLARFMAKVQKTPTCWLWTGSLFTQTGYGCFRLERQRKSDVTHRVSWRIFRGPIPPGVLVLHDCRPNEDTRSCVRPSHLWLGSYQDNVDDMWMKGRGSYGSKHGRAKLCDAQVRAIRTSPEDDETVAATYALSRGHVRAIRNRSSWARLQ